LFASKEQLYSAAVAREIGRFTDELRATYAATTELRLGERIDARAAWLVASVRDRPARYRLLVRAFHTWPADDLPRGAELRASIIDALEELARTEARRDG